MVQAGVNPFPTGPGFPAAPALNTTDGTIPVAVTVKNDSLGAAIKSDPAVNISPGISQAFSNSIASQFSPSVLATHAVPATQQQTTISSTSLPLTLSSVSIANSLEKQQQPTQQIQQQVNIHHINLLYTFLDLFI